MPLKALMANQSAALRKRGVSVASILCHDEMTQSDAEGNEATTYMY